MENMEKFLSQRGTIICITLMLRRHHTHNKKVFTGLYQHYQWTGKEIEKLTEAHILTPIQNGSSEKTDENQVYCQICYCYYPKINETRCCHSSICTECYAACVNRIQSECPFCRAIGFTVMPNLDAKHATKNEPTDIPNVIYDEERVAKWKADNPSCSALITILMKRQWDEELISKVLKLVSDSHADQDFIISLLSYDDISSKDIIKSLEMM